jgi:NAD(P)H dehydrogenase (quinone)
MVELNKPIAVLGAAGITGRSLVAELERRGLPVRTVVRRANQGVGFRDARVADFQIEDEISRAISGARAIHFIPPSFNEKEPAFASNLIAAAEKAGVARITYHSVLHAPTPAMPHHWRKSQVELMLRESSLHWTILQPAMYTQTWLTFLDETVGEFTPPFDIERLFNPVDLRDVTEATANVLTAEGHEFATYELAGKERFAPSDMAKIIQVTLGLDIHMRQAPTDAFARVRAERKGWSPQQTNELIAMYRHYGGFGLPGNGRVLEMLLGRDPNSFAAAVLRERRGIGAST